MIKVSKRPIMYSIVTKVSTEAMMNKIFMKHAVLDNKLKLNIKNIFKIVKLKPVVGLDRDDFVKHLTSIRTDYLVYTFKR